MDNYFVKLFSVNVNDKIEKKNGLSYVSWSYSWAEIKKQFPDATYTVYENKDGWNYHTDGNTCWVKTGMTVNGIEHIEMLPVMDFKNRSIPLNDVTSMDVNKAIQRSLTKAAARHGLGLYVYAGEDLPEEEAEAKKQELAQAKEANKIKPVPKAAPAVVEVSATIPKVAELSEEMKFLNNELNFLADQSGKQMAEVKALYGLTAKELIKQGKLPDKKLTVFSKDEITVVLDLIAEMLGGKAS